MEKKKSVTQLMDAGNKRERNYFLDTLFKGIQVLIPIIVLWIVLNWVFGLIIDFTLPLSNLFDPGQNDPHWIFKLIALLIVLGIIFCFGLIVKNRKGREKFQVFENRYLRQIPLYGLILETVNQFTGLKEMPFKKVVLIDPFKTGVIMTGFITDNIKGKLFTVFVPTAPNPTNGFIYHVKKDQITFTDANPEQVMRSIVGMGTGTSQFISPEIIKNTTEEAQQE